MNVPGSERLIVVVGPSGAGKDSVLQAWLRGLAPADAPCRVRRVITRSPDPHGEDHEATDAATFARSLASGCFIFHWTAHGLHYGVRPAALAPLAAGRWVVLNGSRAHLPQLRMQAPDALVVEVTAPAAVRADRLAHRAREDAPAVAARLARDAPASGASLVVVNDGDLEAAVARLHRWWRARSVVDAGAAAEVVRAGG